MFMYQMIYFTFNVVLFKSLLNCVPCVLKKRCVVLTCLACLRAPVPTCFAWLHANVLTCFACTRAHMPICLECLRSSRVNMPCVLMYSRAIVACDLTCSHANMPWVPCFTRLARPCNHLPTCFVSSVCSFNATFFSFTAIVVEVVHTAGKV